MAENIQVIRLEVSQTQTDSSSSSTSNISPGTLVATSSVRTSVGTKRLGTRGFKQFKEITERLYPDVKIGTGFIGGIKEGFKQRGLKRYYSSEADKLLPGGPSEALSSNVSHSLYSEEASKQSFINARIATGSALKKYGPKAITLATAASALYSKHKADGYNLSGAEHAAGRQQRQSTALTFGAGLTLSIASGNYLATTFMLVGRAIQLGMQNRQEIYQLRSSQLVSSIMKERLVTNTIQRRF